MSNIVVPSFGYVATPDALLSLIKGEAMPNGNLSIRGVARMADVSDTAIMRGADFNAQRLAEILTQQGFQGADLAKNGFPPLAVILTLEYFAYESKAKAPGAKALMRLFGAYGLKTVLEGLKEQPASEVKYLPSRDAIDYVNAAEKLPTLKVNPQLKQLLEDALTDDLELMRNQKLLGGSKKEYTIVKVRAKELGYPVDKIENGSQLGKFVKQRLQPVFSKRIGDYNVHHYEVTPQLDDTIHAFFR